jgi:hypothetical protein
LGERVRSGKENRLFAMRKAGRLAALEQEEGGVLLHIEYKEEALEAMEEGQAVCEAVSQKAARGGCLTLSDGQNIPWTRPFGPRRGSAGRPCMGCQLPPWSAGGDP